MNLDTVLSPYSLIFLASFLMGVSGPHFKSRRKMMLFKFFGDGLASLYLFLMGGTSGACGALIAGTGALTQALTPHHYLKKTQWLRIGMALVLSAISIVFVYKTPIDILPLSMVIICRFGELQKESQRIRFVYWITCFPWMVYHFINGLYLPLFATVILSISLLWSMIRHHHPKPNDAN